MPYNVLDYLEQSVRRVPKKLFVCDGEKEYSYAATLQTAKCVGASLCQRIKIGSPVAVYMENGADAVCTFFGIVYAGGFYCQYNPDLPDARLTSMQSVLAAEVVITNERLFEHARELFPKAELLLFSALAGSGCEADLTKREIREGGAEGENCREAVLAKVRRTMIDTDPLYLNFTSGSTGVPKGILVCHRSVIDFTEQFTKLFQIDETDVIANQAPFDFDVSVKDIYSAVKTGATLVVVPRRLFREPVPLLDFLCEHKVTTFIWAVSALCLISTFHGLDYKCPQTARRVLFSGEVMPYKHLKDWRTHLPEAVFVNLYGPTEITCNCTYHILEKDRDYADGIPIGIPFPNEDVILLDEEGKRIETPGITGEICVRGTALALGYYKNPEQTAAHFVQNPCNPFYPELIYKTGDLGKRQEDGTLVFCGRKDFQVKYRGHRIELEEIERAMSAMDGVERCCCVFDEKKARLLGYYIGSVEKEELHRKMAELLPVFMVPGILRRMEEFPLTKNGKLDRKRLAEGAGKGK